MYRYRDIVTECVIIQYIDSEKQQYIDQPSANWNPIGFEEEWRSLQVELRAIAGTCYKEELHECQKGSFGLLDLES